MHILVNDFIGGVLDRGIPLYVRNLAAGLKEEGHRVTVLRAPSFFRVLPRAVFYGIAVLFEQAVVPVIGLVLRAGVTIYPYNSVAMLDVLSGRGRIVIHDLEQLNRGLSPSKLYYLVCYRVLKWRDYPIFVISKLTQERLAASGIAGHGPMALLPNTFYEFETLLRSQSVARADKKSILLCTGSTANKDLATVISEYLPKMLRDGFRVSILGLHKRSDFPKLESLGAFIASGQLRLCGQLSDAQVAAEYQAHEIVWVHALREGFGRCVVEGRLAGSRVICTAIPEFSALADADVYLYRDTTEFFELLARLVRTDAPIASYSGYPYRDMLRAAFPVTA